jgi:protein-disulfide isomerase
MREKRMGNAMDVSEGDHVRGPRSAKSTILVYGDYECPYTHQFEQTLARLRSRQPAAAIQFRSVFRFFPLREIHPHAQAAAEAAECVCMLAGDDAFWTMHDGLFANQHALDQSGLELRGEEAGVEPGRLRAALADHRAANRVEHDIESGVANGVDGTPSIFLNGERYRGPRDATSLLEALEGEV